MAIISDLVVSYPVLRLMKEPYHDSEVLDELLYGMVVHKVFNCEHSHYVRVRTDYGYEGWCRKDCLLTNEWSVRKYINQTNARVHTLFLDVHKQPSVKSRVLFTASKGSFLAIPGECEDGWTKVYLVNGEFGYVRCSGIIMNEEINNCKDYRSAVVNDAMMYLGVQYRWGGKTAQGIDCSGLSSMVYLNNGMIIHRDSNWEDGFGIKKISLQDALCGDLLYFKGHIGIYLENGRFIHSTLGRFGDGVRINSLYKGYDDYREDLKEKFLYAGRKIN